MIESSASAIAGDYTKVTSDHVGRGSATTPLTNMPPMLATYLGYKAQYPDCLLLCQVGDFYEVFFDDAVTVAKTLNLTLTSRDKNSANPVPMCGVPILSVDGYLNRLVTAGFSVAVVSQCPAAAETSDASANGAQNTKGIMARYLERIVTPGVQVLGEGALAENSAANSSAGEPRVGAVTCFGANFSLAFTNITSGIIFVREELSRDEFLADVSRAALSEIILPILVDTVKIDKRLTWVRSLVGLMGERAVKFRSFADRSSDVKDSHAPQSFIAQLRGSASVGTQGKRAAFFLKEYVDETTAQRTAPFEQLQIYSWDRQLALDSATRRTLELVTNASDGSQRHTLFSSINLTQSSGGARLLRRWLLAPSNSIAEIEIRQQRTEALISDDVQLLRLQDSLRIVSDVERIATRIALRAVNPRELAALRDALFAAENIGRDIQSHAIFSNLADRCRQGYAIANQLADILIEEPAASIGDGGYVIAVGKDEVLDRARELEKNGHGLLSKLESDERIRTGVSTLKIKLNNQLGYFFEVTKQHAEKLPADFQRRQSVAAGERFFTTELKNLEQDLFSASGKARARELQLFSGLVTTLQPQVALLRDLGQGLSEVDVFTCFARLARERTWTKPIFIPNSTELIIASGRHPVLEQILAEKFIPNNLALQTDSLNLNSAALIVTGPNMGGKSTFLRQTAHLVILAQVGSFVPAARMRLGVVDGVFARLGASDNLAEGDSTFMVEMREAALICAAATKQSLVVIDEIGRGTATADGRALAQSILEWLVVQIKCRVLFATHFHELTDLSASYPQIRNVSVAAIEKDGAVHFTHEIVAGPANRSYGIEVAGHAGLPQPLLARARELLRLQSDSATLLNSASSNTGKQASGALRSAKSDLRQLSIFTEILLPAQSLSEGSKAESPHELAGNQPLNTTHADIIEQLKKFNVNESTPMQALGLLATLHTKLQGSASLEADERKLNE